MQRLCLSDKRLMKAAQALSSITAALFMLVMTLMATEYIDNHVCQTSYRLVLRLTLIAPLVCIWMNLLNYFYSKTKYLTKLFFNKSYYSC